MSKKNVVLSASAEAIVSKVQSLKGVRGTSVNIRSIWVDAPEKGKTADALKGMGFKFAPKKGQWWLTPAEAPAQKVSTPVKAEPKKAPKPQAEKAQPKAEKAQKPQKVYEELPAVVQAYVKAQALKKFPGVQVQIVGTWVRLSGEATKAQKESIKAEGFHWASSEDKKYWSREIPQAWMPAPAPAQNAPKAEPKKAQPKARKTVKAQPTMGAVL